MLRNATVTSGKKIRRIGDLLVGYSGPQSMAEQFFKWVEGGFVEDKFPKSLADSEKAGCGLVIRADRTIWLYDQCSIGFETDKGYCAIGAGAEGAMAAMYLKHNAAEAVEAAVDGNCLCGQGIDILEFSTPKPTKGRRTK